MLALLAFAPVAFGDWLGFHVSDLWRGLAAALGLFAVVCTSMIYAQIRAVPRWSHWTTPVLFVVFALAGGALLALQGAFAGILLCLLGAVQIATFALGDAQFGARGATLSSATGLGFIGRPSVFEQPHTGENYLLREMIFVVGRRHAARLRVIAVLFASAIPAALAFTGNTLAEIAAVAVHLTGAFAARWLFFAEAEHVVGLYYGKR